MIRGDAASIRHWPLTAPTPASQQAAAKRSWHFTLLDRTLCFGEAPPGVTCTVRFDPSAATPSGTMTANRRTDQAADESAT